MADQWIERSRRHCESVLRENERPSDPEELRTLLNKNYPYGERQYHPYKCWLMVLEEYCGPSDAKKARQRKKMAELMAKVGQGELI